MFCIFQVKIFFPIELAVEFRLVEEFEDTKGVIRIRIHVYIYIEDEQTIQWKLLS